MITAFQFLVAYLIVDVLCAVLTVIIASKVTRDAGSEIEVQYFNLLLSAFLVFVVFDAVWAILNYSGLFEPGEVLLSIVNGINLTAIAFDAYFWLGFMLARFKSVLTNRRRYLVLLAVPAMTVPVLHAIGFFTGQNVIIQLDGGMTYGICHTLIVCIQLSYILAATAFAARRRVRAKTRSERRLCVTFISFMVPFIVGGIVDTLIAGTPVAAASIVVSLTFVMMSMQESRISSDALTGLNNRRRADEYLEASIARVSPDHPLLVFLIDLDDFKDVNDTYGHLEGDRALQLMADVLRMACGQLNAFAARWGGDEFLVICVDALDIQPEFIAGLIQGELADEVRGQQLEYELTCSIGFAKCKSPDDSAARLVAQADQMLYRNKRAR